MYTFFLGFGLGAAVLGLLMVILNLKKPDEVDDLEEKIRAAKPDYDALIKRLKEIKAELRKK